MKKNSVNITKFAEGFCFKKLFIVFVIGCIFGALYEETYCYLRMIYYGDSPVWILHRGVIYGPFSPIYGIGAVLMTYILATQKRKWWQTFLLAAIIGGMVEYGIGYLQETFVGTISWDYSNKFLNIGGRTTIPYMFFWGLLGVIFVKYIYPFLSNTIEKIPIKPGNIIVNILVVFLFFDCLISWTALYRQMRRRQGFLPTNIVETFYDKYYTDEFLYKYYQNMIPTNKEK